MPRLWPRASFVWPQALVVALLAALWASVALAAANFPPLTGRVVDQANILSPVTIADLERKLADLEQKSRIQLVVATVPSLGGGKIEPYAKGRFAPGNWARPKTTTALSFWSRRRSGGCASRSATAL